MSTTQATTYGTAHFQSVEAARRHFSDATDNARAFVAHSIATGDIIIGRPLLRHGQTLSVINGRYHVTEGGI
jgi:hypothetical protein